MMKLGFYGCFIVKRVNFVICVLATDIRWYEPSVLLLSPLLLAYTTKRLMVFNKPFRIVSSCISYFTLHVYITIADQPALCQQ